MSGQTERLKSIIRLYNSSMSAFEKKCGLSNATISLPFRQGKNLSAKTIKTICKNFPINENWLYYGQGEIFKEDLSLAEHIVKTLYELGTDFRNFEAEYGLSPGTVISVLENPENEAEYDLLEWVQFLQNKANSHYPVIDFSWVKKYSTTENLKEPDNKPCDEPNEKSKSGLLTNYLIKKLATYEQISCIPDDSIGQAYKKGLVTATREIIHDLFGTVICI